MTSNIIKRIRRINSKDIREYILNFDKNIFIKTYKDVSSNIQQRLKLEYLHSRVLHSFIYSFHAPTSIHYSPKYNSITYPLLKHFITAQDLLSKSYHKTKQGKNKPNKLEEKYTKLIYSYRKEVLQYLIKITAHTAFKVNTKNIFIGDLAVENIGVNISKTVCNVKFIDAGPTPLCPDFHKGLVQVYSKLNMHTFKNNTAIQNWKDLPSNIVKHLTSCQNAIFLFSIFIGINKHLLNPSELLFRIRLAKMFTSTWLTLKKSPATTSSIFITILKNEIKRASGTGKFKAFLKALLILLFLPFML